MRFEALRETSSLSLVDSRSNIINVHFARHVQGRISRFTLYIRFQAFWRWKFRAR